MFWSNKQDDVEGRSAEEARVSQARQYEKERQAEEGYCR